MYEAGSTLSHVYFPTTAIVSLLYVMHNGESAEIAVVGNEGVVGVSLFMGGESTSSRARVQSAGGAFRLTAPLMKEEFYRAGPVLHLLLRYIQALITQMVQTAAYNKHHSLDQQLCRWLLLSLDRLQGPEMGMTRELIANMLGISPKKAVEGAHRLQKEGLINYAEGRIRVLAGAAWRNAAASVTKSSGRSTTDCCPINWRPRPRASRSGLPGGDLLHAHDPFRMPLQHAQRPQCVPVASLADTGFHVNGKTTGVDSI
jgi:CRP-like cAMP-binding protein